MEYINKLSIQIDQKQILDDVEFILEQTPLWPNQQISLTSVTGNDDWDCSIGKIADLQHKESDFTVIENWIKHEFYCHYFSIDSNFPIFLYFLPSFSLDLYLYMIREYICL